MNQAETTCTTSCALQTKQPRQWNLTGAATKKTFQSPASSSEIPIKKNKQTAVIWHHTWLILHPWNSKKVYSSRNVRVYRAYTTCTGEKDIQSHPEQFIVLARLRSACLRCDQTLRNGTAEQQNTRPLPLPLTHARYTQEMTSCWVSLGSAARLAQSCSCHFRAQARARSRWANIYFYRRFDSAKNETWRRCSAASESSMQ